MTIQTELINDWNDALFGKYIHTVIDYHGTVLRVYSSDSKIPNEMQPEFNRDVEQFMNALKT